MFNSPETELVWVNRNKYQNRIEDPDPNCDLGGERRIYIALCSVYREMNLNHKDENDKS